MKPTEPRKVRLFCGVLYSDLSVLEKIKIELEKKFGLILSESEAYMFDFTDYYEKEIGGNLKKKFLVFKKLIDPGKISSIKLFTNKLEDKFSVNGKRKVNLDPGYFDVNKLVLGSAKESTNKIYIGKGIYTDITYFFKNDNVQETERTFPDFRTENVKQFFINERKRLKNEPDKPRI